MPAFVQGDAQVYPFEAGTFDVALSRAGAMFFADQVAAFTNIARAMRPGGHLALVSWRSAPENEWISALRQALLPGAPAPEPPENAPTPFRHADRRRTTALLAASGFEEVDLEPLDIAMYFGRDAEEGFPVLRDLLGWMVRDLDPTAAEDAFGRLREPAARPRDARRRGPRGRGLADHRTPRDAMTSRTTAGRQNQALRASENGSWLPHGTTRSSASTPSTGR